MKEGVVFSIDKSGSFTDKMTFKQRTGGCRRVSHVDIQGKSISGPENCLCKGPETGVCLVCSRKSKEESAARVEKVWGEW